MRRIFLGLIGVGCAFASAHAIADAKSGAPPSSAGVVSKMIDAYGGRATLDAIKTKVEVLSLSIQGEPGTITNTQEAPNKFLELVSIPAYRVSVTTGYDGSNGWIVDSYGHVRALTGDQLATARCQAADAVGSLLHPEQTSATFALQPNQTVDGKSYLVLLFSQKGCPTTSLYVDPQTYLIGRFVNELQTIDLSDYTSGPLGEKYPKTLAITSAEGTAIATVTSLKDNPQIDETIFTMPPIPSPLPSASAPAPAASASPPAAPPGPSAASPSPAS